MQVEEVHKPMNIDSGYVFVLEDCSINLKYTDAIGYLLYLSAGFHLERQIKSLIFSILKGM
jgi:hypothetical protein